MTIYKANGVELYDAPITSKDIIKCVLMGDYYIELSFNTGAYIDFSVGSYILYQGRKFEILYTQYPDAHHGGYKYTLRFDAQQGKMKKAKVFWLASANYETTFSNTAKLADFGQLIVANMNRYLGGDNWLWGGVSAYEDDVLKPVSFNGDFCWDALSNIASTFGVEWWTVEDGDEVRLYMGKLEVGTPETFKVGEVITSIPTRRGEDAEYGTRFYVFGSTRNIPEDYDTTEQGGPTNHISQKRLHLPDGIQYIDAIEGLTPEQIVEQVVFFEDVYPKNTETVTAVDIEYKEIVEGEENAVYIMQCNDTPFTPDNLITGETLGCKFTSGDLNGREFELIIDTENFDQRFEIKAQTEDAGDTVLVIPNEYLHPKQGDTFVLTGVKLPTERIREAEEELLDVGTAWAMKKSSDTNVYDCPTNPVYCRENDKNYDIGQVVRLVGMQFGNIGRLSRIQSYEKKLYDEYQATYTVGDNTPYSRMGSIEKSIEASAYAERIGIASGVGVYVIRSKYDLTTPTDTNVYSALYTALEYLSKRKGGNIAGPVTFDKSLTTSDFKQGELMGAGAGIYDDGKGNKVVEADKIIVRKEAIFNELVINQTTFQRGTTVFSSGGCRLTAVEEYDTYYRCYYDNKHELRFAGLEVEDLARCQRYDSSYGDIVKYYWRLVVGVGDDYVDLSKADCDGAGVPEVGDDIVQLGNRTDNSRQSAVVISPLNGGAVEVFAGVNSFSLSEKNFVGIGVNAATGKAYMYGYGDFFAGDRNKALQYIEYKDGELNIKANVTLGAESDLSDVKAFSDILNTDVITASDFQFIEQEMRKIEYEYDTIQQEAARILPKDESLGMNVTFGYYEFTYQNYYSALSYVINQIKAGNAYTNIDAFNAAKSDYYAALETITNLLSSTRDDNISDLDYLKKIFPNALLDVNGATLSLLLGVKDGTDNDAMVVAGLYGGGDETLNSNGFYDNTHGALLFFAGANEGIDAGRVADAMLRIYEDGTIIAAGGKIVFNPDGSGQLASGRLSWSANGKMTSRFPTTIDWQDITTDDDGYVDFSYGGYLIPDQFGRNYKVVASSDDFDSFELRGNMTTRSSHHDVFLFDTRVRYYTGEYNSSSASPEYIEGSTLYFSSRTNANGVAKFTRDYTGSGDGWILETNLIVGDDGVDITLTD